MKYALKMAEVIGDPKEVLTLALSPVSPLTIPDHEAEAVIEIAKAGVAFGALPCPTAGATSPMTISGSIAQQNAETLAVVVLSQIGQPRSADHLLRTAGNDGAAHRRFGLGRRGTWLWLPLERFNLDIITDSLSTCMGSRRTRIRWILKTDSSAD